MSLLRYAFLGLIAVLFITFAIVNRQAVTLSFFPLPYDVSMPQFLFAILCFALGVVVAGMISSVKMAKLRHRFSHEHKRAVALENELQGIKLQDPGKWLPSKSAE